MEHSISRRYAAVGDKPSGSEVVNLIHNAGGALQRLSFPTDAVIIQLTRVTDPESGEERWQRFTSVSVVTPELKAEIIAEARRIIAALDGAE